MVQHFKYNSLQKLIAKKCVGPRGGMPKKESVTTTDGGRHDKILSENSQLIQHHQPFPSSDSDERLKTAVEMDRSDLDKKLVTANHSSKSTFTTSSISPYRRSLSPDTMLQVFGMKNMIVTRASNDTLVQYWWDLTPDNIHTIVINYLYDSDNRRCDQCWRFVENKLGISRLVVFYILIGAYFLYILSGDLAKLLYYIMGIAYPMYKTYITFENRGLNACRSWLRYWIVFGWLALLDVFFHRYLKYWTVYWSIKIIITIYLLIPLVKGADLIYRDFIKNFNKNIEQNIQLIIGK
ncbi:unnamed protein product [Cercopithifilaria johnstoni]|uniref:Receptor expression-enhancing protein n=1 Tax=Cercopithifilaria johnstoni TaxID=2874296 RepID=A0A8J2M1K8_9BILA|nr:unnamed protein product [Cercopithifilaria johnstoni]